MIFFSNFTANLQAPCRTSESSETQILSQLLEYWNGVKVFVVEHFQVETSFQATIDEIRADQDISLGLNE